MFAATQGRDQRRGNDPRRALREDACLRHADRGHVPNRVDAGKARRKRLRVDGHVAVFGEAARENDIGRAVLRHAEEQVERQLGAVVEDGDTAAAVERRDAALRDELDLALGERCDQRS